MSPEKRQNEFQARAHAEPIYETNCFDDAHSVEIPGANAGYTASDVNPKISPGDRFGGRSNHQQHPSWMAVGIVRPRQQSNQQLERSYKITK